MCTRPPCGRRRASRIAAPLRSEAGTPSITGLGELARRTHYGAKDFDMRAAATEIVAQRRQRLLFGGPRVDRKQRLGGHDHAVEAVAALRGLLVDESLLHHIRLVAGAEPLERHDVAAAAAADRNDAGARRRAIDQDSAGAAFTEAATVFRTVEREIVAQHVEQRRVSRRSDLVDPAVHGDADRCLRHPRSQIESLSAAAKASRNSTSAQNPRCDDTVCTQTCKPCMPQCSANAFFVDRADRQMRFYAAGVCFAPHRRLTAIGRARNIVRVQMITALSAGFDMVTEPTSAAIDKIRCDACPVMCYIKPGAAGACDRYANHEGKLVRVDPHVILERTVSHGGKLVPFSRTEDWDGKIVHEPSTFVTAIGAGTPYPDYKPAPFIVSAEVDGVDMVTVVTEGIFSYCGIKVKIDTDRYLGPETATVRAQGEAIGHVTTSEYGSQMLSLGGVHHLTGGSKKEGRVTCDALMDLSNCKAVELTIDGGATVVVQAGYPPIVNGIAEERMRVGCGSATIGMFAKQWHGKVDEVVVVDDHITGVLSEHQAGKLLDIPDTGIKMKGRRSTPGRYFQVADPGTGWGGTNISDPLAILGPFDAKEARAGLSMLMVSTTGEHSSYYVLDEALKPVETEMPADLKFSVERIQENCEPALCTVLFMAGAGGSLRAGVTDNPVRLTRSVKDALTRVTSGGAPVYVWPGGGITYMVDVTQMPSGAFGYVPTPALVAPIEFTLRLSDYAALGGHMDHVRPLASLKDKIETLQVSAPGLRA